MKDAARRIIAFLDTNEIFVCFIVFLLLSLVHICATKSLIIEIFLRDFNIDVFRLYYLSLDKDDLFFGITFLFIISDLVEPR